MRTLLIIILTTLCYNSFCCSCKSTQSISESFQNYAYVVAGTIINKEPVLQVDSVLYNKLMNKGSSERQALRITSEGFMEFTIVLVEPAYKGAFSSDTITVRTAFHEARCGYNFEIGQNYVVYGYNSNESTEDSKSRHEAFWTNICTRTGVLNEKEKAKLQKLAERAK